VKYLVIVINKLGVHLAIAAAFKAGKIPQNPFGSGSLLGKDGGVAIPPPGMMPRKTLKPFVPANGAVCNLCTFLCSSPRDAYNNSAAWSRSTTRSTSITGTA